MTDTVELSSSIEDQETRTRQAEACQAAMIILFSLPTKEREVKLVEVCGLARKMTADHLDTLPTANVLSPRLQAAVDRVLETGWRTQSFGGWEEPPVIYDHPWKGTYSIIAGNPDGTIRGHLHNIGQGVGKYTELTGTALVKWILGLHIYKGIKEGALPETDEIIDDYARRYFARIFGERKYGGTINKMAYLIQGKNRDTYDWRNRHKNREAIYLSSNGAEPLEELRAGSLDLKTASAINPWTGGSRYDAIFVGEVITFLEEPDLKVNEPGLPPGVIKEPSYTSDRRAEN